MSMKKTVKISRNILLIFVFISIGFALGRNFSSQSSKDKISIPKSNANNNTYIEVYYFHSTFRCSTCNKIEKMTVELLKAKYSTLLNSKEILFTEVDFQANEKLAENYGIVASCVVVALRKGDKTVEYKRLDEVWTLIDKPNEFNKYISDTINAYLKKLKE